MDRDPTAVVVAQGVISLIGLVVLIVIAVWMWNAMSSDPRCDRYDKKRTNWAATQDAAGNMDVLDAVDFYTLENPAPKGCDV